MKPLDRLLQRWRMEKVRPWIQPGTRLLDIGCGDGALFRLVNDRLDSAVGIDPHIHVSYQEGKVRYVAGELSNLSPSETFDVITMLAVLEHVRPEEQSDLMEQCGQRLRSEGTIVLTVPSPLVDWILKVLIGLRWMEGQDADQHYGFDVKTTPDLFKRHGFTLVVHRRFQLGLNNLFVFRKAT